MTLNCIAVTQAGLKQLRRSGNIYPHIEDAQKVLKPGKEIKAVYLMDDKTLAVQSWIKGYTIE